MKFQTLQSVNASDPLKQNKVNGKAVRDKFYTLCDEQENSCYIDTRFLLPTSNICERLFLVAGHALGERRKYFTTLHFEEQMF